MKNEEVINKLKSNPIFKMAMEMAENDEQRAYIEKASLDLIGSIVGLANSPEKLKVEEDGD